MRTKRSVYLLIILDTLLLRPSVQLAFQNRSPAYALKSVLQRAIVLS